MTYLHPGVYLEEIPSGSKPIEGVATSIAAFVGETHRGPVGEPVLIHSYDDYVRTFGSITSRHDAMGFALSAFYQNGGKTAYVARVVDSDPPSKAASQALVGTGNQPVLTLSAESVGTWGNNLRFTIEKANATDLSFDLHVGFLDGSHTFVPAESFTGLDMNERSDNYAPKRVNGVSSLVVLTLEPAADPDQQNLFLQGRVTGGDASNVDFDTYTDNMTLTLNIDNLGPRTIDLGTRAELLGQDNAVTAEMVREAVQKKVRALGPSQTPYKDFTCTFDNTSFTLTSGSVASYASVRVYDGPLAALMKLKPAEITASVHGSKDVIPVAVAGDPDQGEAFSVQGESQSPTPEDYRQLFSGKLSKVRDISILLLPGQSMPEDGSGNQALSHALAHCEAMANRMLILDLEKGLELENANDVGDLVLPTSTYAVSYYPWVWMTNPLHDPDQNPNEPHRVAVAPSAFAAGMWSKIDGRRGVWKAPAGVETSLTGSSGLQFDVGDGDQDQLNPLGINCIRTLPSYGRVIWGSRTLATKAAPEWRYVPVRRTAIFIEQSIYNSIQWAVFEPNNHVLWSNLRVNIETFMNGLFRSGAFQGETASKAYFVRCGLGDTMTQGDIDRGQVIVLVGFAPLKPAEFVIVRIQQIVGQD